MAGIPDFCFLILLSLPLGFLQFSASLSYLQLSCLMNLGLLCATFLLAASNSSLITIVLLRRLLSNYNKYVTRFLYLTRDKKSVYMIAYYHDALFDNALKLGHLVSILTSCYKPLKLCTSSNLSTLIERR